MIHVKLAWLRWTPVKWAIFFSLPDIFAIVFLKISYYFLSSEEVTRESMLGRLNDFVTLWWRKIHLPLGRLLEPLYFPAIVTHPSQISEASIIAFQLSCALPFTLLGFLVGLLLMRFKR
ncbi:hypothetical protein [Massilia pseudoviolaceinigra]|uniref:hypothetical protein n=1 Tax=Massilia pseudoviolaceinigra TaxID=3057165 RepID=UPI0027967BBA|nr:hypothetical protein [Massilia sp. CCM 9206]MDQ1921445.1 hypothetical protein [Massilia sp. CCM 9206]